MKHFRPGEHPSRRLDILRFPRAPFLVLSLLLLGTASGCYSIASPSGWADPAFTDDGSVVYFTPTHGKLEAYDKSANKSVWEIPNDQTKQIKLDAVYSTPVLSTDGQTIYCAGYSGMVYALDRASGQPRWNFDTGSPIIGGLLLENGVLYVGNSQGHVVALQTSDGKQLWQKTAGNRVWSTPVDAGGLIAVTSMDGNVYAFNAQGGLAWKSGAGGAAIASTPQFEDSRLTFGGFDKRFHAIRSDNGEPIWSTPAAGNWFWTQGLLSGDTLYAGNLDGHLYAYDATNGSFKWQVDLGSPIRSAPVLAGGTLVVAGRNGMIHGLDPQDGHDKWPPSDAGGSILANLVVPHLIVPQGNTPQGNTNTVYAATQPGSKNSARVLQIDPSNGTPKSVIAP